MSEKPEKPVSTERVEHKPKPLQEDGNRAGIDINAEHGKDSESERPKDPEPVAGPSKELNKLEKP